MLRRTRFHATATTLGLAAALLLSVPAATALESSGYSLEILVDGSPLTEYSARNTSYIEARKKAEYSIRLCNHTNRRVAIALSVDGLNTINAKTTTAAAASKWVLDPYQTITIDGWQTGPDTARRFFFTTEDSSYGAWLDKTSNLGVIEAVVFREKRKLLQFRDKRSELREGKSPPRSQGALDSESVESDDLAATGIGDEVDNPVTRVRFNAERRSAADLRIRYEYRAQLVDLGVLPHRNPLDRRERARGFDDFEFAPDPYEGRHKKF